MIRSPIIVVLGHVDAGKTTILDKIRGTAIAKKEAGGITQHIGATEVPREVLVEISKPLLHLFNFEIKIPGLLFVDTPGHESFTNLRKRGGSVADLAIIVVDVFEGFKPQTYEAVEICKQFKVPFLIALNKIDKIPGWIPNENQPFLESIAKQPKKVVDFLEEKVYTIIGSLYELGFDSERFDRVRDFSRQVAIIPVSAKTGEGVPELLLITSALAQKFLEKKLDIDINKPGIGIILEKKEQKGYGKVIDVILYEGKIRKGDEIAFLTKNGVKTSKVKIILKPTPLKEIRDKSTKFQEVNEVTAASGIRIVADNLDDVVPGSTLYVVSSKEDLEKIIKKSKEEVEEFLFETDKAGVIVKADTLGSLEAIVRILKEKKIPISKADIGNITKEDIMKLNTIKEKDPTFAVILGFNVKVEDTAEELIKSLKVNVILENVIYRLIEKVEEHIKHSKDTKIKSILDQLTSPAKLYVLPGNVFRRSNPAIVGVEVLEGKLRPGCYLMRGDGKILGKVLSIQYEGKNLGELRKGEKAAIAISDVVVGRHFEEGDYLYTYVSEEEFKRYKEYKNYLSEDEKSVLREIAKIMREKNPTWGL